jgi:hypothetical protein
VLEESADNADAFVVACSLQGGCAKKAELLTVCDDLVHGSTMFKQDINCFCMAISSCELQSVHTFAVDFST